MIKPFPIIALLGDRGAGKSAFGTYLVEEAIKEGANVYTNIELNIDHPLIHNIDFEAIKKNPEVIGDGYLIMDEMHVGSDSYEFLSKNNRELSVFATQIRKRKITWIYLSQRYNRIDKRLRDQTDYIYEIKGVYHLMKLNEIIKPVYDYSIVKIFDIVDTGRYETIKTFVFNGRLYFNHFNTNQLILRNENLVES